MPKLPSFVDCCPLPSGFLNEEGAKVGEAGVDWVRSNNWFAGDEIIDREVINEEITSGLAG